MKKYKLPEVPTRRTALVVMLAFASFILGEYSERGSFTAWGEGAIILAVAVSVTALFALMYDFWTVK